MFTCTTNSPEETAHLAELVGQKIREGTVLCLEGDLGAGKTLFVQSLAHTLGVEGEVTSPTFNLMNVYEGICPIYHFDLYRLETEEELEDIGFDEYAGGDGVTLIEWAELFSEQLPEEYLQITLRLDGAGRRAVLEPKGARYEELLGEVEKDADFGN